MAKQVLLKDKMVSHKGITLYSTPDGGLVHVTIDTPDAKEIKVQLTGEQYLALYDIAGHLVDWE